MSAIVIDRTPTNRFLGICTPCNRPVAVEVEAEGREVTENCTECAQPVTLERLVAVTTTEACNGDCMGAVGPSCSCGCGGKNHGKSFVAHKTHYEVEKAVEKYRKASIKRAAAAKKAAETRAAKKAAAKQERIDGWFASLEGAEAATITWLLEDPAVEENGFLCDMRSYVRRFKNGNSKYDSPLTERQLAAVVKCHAREIEFAARQAERAAEAAAAAPVPLGNGLTVEGEIVHTKTQDGYGYHALEHKMLIRGDDGWKVWVTIPGNLLPAVYNTVEWDLHMKSLKGRRVRFVANVELGRDGDVSFGIAKRPRKAELIDA